MLLSLLLFAAPAAIPPTESLLGDWVTPNRSIVHLYNCGSTFCAKIAYVDPKVGQTTDGQNPDEAKRRRPLCGLVIGTGFAQKDASHADGGKLYDPESGNTYSGTMTLADSSTLKLRGFIGVSLFGRTENWHRAEAPPPACR